MLQTQNNYCAQFSPSPDIAGDEAMLKQLTRDFTKLKASEKKAVLEMTRIMANA